MYRFGSCVGLTYHFGSGVGFTQHYLVRVMGLRISLKLRQHKGRRGGQRGVAKVEERLKVDVPRAQPENLHVRTHLRSSILKRISIKEIYNTIRSYYLW
jgi:hypothetical protein